RPRGPGRHQGSLDPDELGNALADAVLQLHEVDEMPGGVRPRRDDFWRHDRPAQVGDGAGGIDDVLEAKSFVDALPNRLRCYRGRTEHAGESDGGAGFEQGTAGKARLFFGLLHLDLISRALRILLLLESPLEPKPLPV